MQETKLGAFLFPLNGSQHDDGELAAHTNGANNANNGKSADGANRVYLKGNQRTGPTLLRSLSAVIAE